VSEQPLVHPALISIAAAERTPILVDLVGTRYQVTPPKSAIALRLAVTAKTSGDDPQAMLDVLDMWLVAAMGKSTAKKIRARMDDPADALDFEHLMKLVEAVTSAAAGNPTTSSSAN
jgi:hypothetical protein